MARIVLAQGRAADVSYSAAMDHPDFWLEFASRVGPRGHGDGGAASPGIRVAHAVLIALGLGLMIASHWAGNHRESG